MRRTTPAVVDIDIGRFGKPISSGLHLITFDPFDRAVVTDRYERWPFAVSGQFQGNSSFYVNRDIPGCSSLLPINPAFANDTQQYRARALKPSGHRCKLTQFALHVRLCRRPKHTEVRTVRTVRLSHVLLGQRVRHINYLKVDAQGADFSIVRDVLRNTNVTLSRLRAECQQLDRAPPFYVAANTPPNDCAALVALVRRHRPESLSPNIEWTLSNCDAAEYNVDFRWGSHAASGLSSQTAAAVPGVPALST
jgi:hypothetical protein